MEKVGKRVRDPGWSRITSLKGEFPRSRHSLPRSFAMSMSLEVTRHPTHPTGQSNMCCVVSSPGNQTLQWLHKRPCMVTKKNGRMTHS